MAIITPIQSPGWLTNLSSQSIWIREKCDHMGNPKLTRFAQNAVPTREYCKSLTRMKAVHALVVQIVEKG